MMISDFSPLRGRTRLVVQFSERVRWPTPFVYRWVQKMGKQFGAFDHSRPGTGKIGVGVDRIDTATLDRRKLQCTRIVKEALGLLGGLCQSATARHDDQDFGRPAHNILPENAD